MTSLYATTLSSGLSGNRQIVTASDVGVSVAPFTSNWTKFVNTSIIAQVNGTATSITATIQRSAVDPGPSGNAAQAAAADSTGFSGNPSTGIVPNVYVETGVGWWRWNVSALSGGSVTVCLSGEGNSP